MLSGLTGKETRGEVSPRFLTVRELEWGTRDGCTGKNIHNGRVLARAGTGLNAEAIFVDSLLVIEKKIAAIGIRKEIEPADLTGFQVHDLQQRTVLPGFIDGHMHLLLLGQSLRKLDLSNCKTLNDIRSSIKSYAKANPSLPTILCKGWRYSMTPNGDPTVRTKFPVKGIPTLDDIDPRPIFVDASSLHSSWCNTAALKELGVADMPDPAGGRIHRDEHGNPSGVLDEGAMMSIIWPYQASSSPKEERIKAIVAAVKDYNAAGYTGVVEMAMDEEAWDAIITLRDTQPDIPIRVAAYWLIKPTTDQEANSRQVICDGIIDACTAFLSEPYAPAGKPPPIWAPEYLEPVVKEANDGCLQVALHAIGDAAVRMAIDAIEKHTTAGRRHRIEHLELASPEDAARLDRCHRAFAYREFADSGVLMAIGSDSPTSPWAPMENLYVAAMRRSARDLTFTGTFNEHFRLGFYESVTAATWGAASSVFDEERTGSLAAGKCADFIVVDMKWDEKSILQAQVEETWFGGRKVWDVRDSTST
ncbi:amidohydrolase family-domain-containing protein [Colletotrichum phormii]|uniref:Amidohydrolase family-domain-containing protein n=1 Tax=Colletotrichum phormii TaxID=359342 RepID=A0AAI9ZKQ7_9PEZI|nr:amidohydrolase family-domain-containing protein [Colletotrichum phormii]KAK1633778.1 amidohydrolase family-domain-containing protein [Colletotrichum phormii]